MPIYEYKCETCGKIFEKFQKINERQDSIKCPVCGSNETKRILSCFSYTGDYGSSSSCGSGGSTGFS